MRTQETGSSEFLRDLYETAHNHNDSRFVVATFLFQIRTDIADSSATFHVMTVWSYLRAAVKMSVSLQNAPTIEFGHALQVNNSSSQDAVQTPDFTIWRDLAMRGQPTDYGDDLLDDVA